jgi:hypothetical protein
MKYFDVMAADNNNKFTCNFLMSYYIHINCQYGGPGSCVGIVTGYALDGPGIESRWGRDFFAHIQTGPGAHPASCTMGIGSFPGVKRPGCGADHPPPSSAEVKKG